MQNDGLPLINGFAITWFEQVWNLGVLLYLTLTVVLARAALYQSFSNFIYCTGSVPSWTERITTQIVLQLPVFAVIVYLFGAAIRDNLVAPTIVKYRCLPSFEQWET